MLEDVTKKNATAARVASGFALGSLLGLTPLLSLHNFLALLALLVFRVSPRGFLIGWLVAIPAGFALDPVFDAVGYAVLTIPVLAPLWRILANAPVIPLTNFNNSIVMGSLVVWGVTAAPSFVLARALFRRYEATVEALFRMPGLALVSGNKLMRRLFAIQDDSRRWVRGGFVVPLAVAITVPVVLWFAFADPATRFSVEKGGWAVFGATVDVRSADVDLSDGLIALAGIEVTDRTEPSRNLLQVEDLAGAVSVAELIEGRLRIDSVVVRGLSFGTPRETPGRVETSPRRSLFAEQMMRWRESARVPPLPTPDISSLQQLGDIDRDSLRVVVGARSIGGSVTASRDSFERRVNSLDVEESLSSARALLSELESTSAARLGVAGAARKAAEVRTAVRDLGGTLDEIGRIRSDFDENLRSLRTGLSSLDSLKRLDYDRVLGQLSLPSLDPGSITDALLREPMMDRVAELLQWVSVVDGFLEDDSPGVLSRLRSFRREGRTVRFPRENEPSFYLGRAFGSISAENFPQMRVDLRDVSSEPRATGRPVVLAANGEEGTSAVALEAVFDRTGEEARDEVRARLVDLPLDPFDLNSVGARLDPGSGETEIALTRTADSVSGAIKWSAGETSWTVLDTTIVTGPARLAWGALSGVSDLNVVLRIGGTLTSPSLSISSNLGDRAASALAGEIGAEVERARSRARARVDELSASAVADARASVSDLESDPGGRLEGYREEAHRIRSELERRLRSLGPRIPGIGG